MVYRNVRSEDIVLTKEQAEKAIKLCLDNAATFLEDANVLMNYGRTEHLAIPMVFAAEEIGKAKIINDKLAAGKGNIVLSKADGIFDHQVKLKAATGLLDLSKQDKIVTSLIYGDSPFDESDPFVKLRINSDVQLFRFRANDGHRIRLVSSFVNFDPKTNDPILPHDLDNRIGNLAHFMKLHKALLDIVDKRML